MPSRHVKPFFLYATSGIASTALELGTLYILLNAVGIVYYAAVPIAFIATTSIHYAVCRLIVFGPSQRTATSEYIYFVLILISGVILTTSLVTALVEFFSVNVYSARILAGIFTMLWDYYLNARFNFRAYWH